MQLPFKIDRPLVFFDLETTGLDWYRDRIVEMALLRYTPDGKHIARVRRFNPGTDDDTGEPIRIPPEATAVHGISDNDVACEPLFRRVAKSLYNDYLAGADLAGFNIRRFDLPLLIREFERTKITFDLEGVRVIDACAIFHAKEPRDLAGAMKFYLGKDLHGTHDAAVDVEASAEVLFAQIEHYGDLSPDMDALHALSEQHAEIPSPLGRWFTENADGHVFKKGKHRGKKLSEVASQEPDYLEWMLDLDDITKEVEHVVGEALQTANPPVNNDEHPSPASPTET